MANNTASEVLHTRPQALVEAILTVPGDKSISHRAAILGALAQGTTRIRHFLLAEDTQATLDCLRKCGVQVEAIGLSEVQVIGGGLRSWQPPTEVLDAGNSGTTMRLLLGALAGHPFRAILTGDASLRRRPMDRVAHPLSKMGARVEGQGTRCLPPVQIEGGTLRPIHYCPPMASAQVKTAVLLAGIYAEGETTVSEPLRSRDHTERMLPLFGATLSVEGTTVSIQGQPRLQGTDLSVPGDLSSAAFFLTAAAFLPGSRITVRDVGINPTRSGFLEVLQEMGAHILLTNQRESSGEPVADVTVQHRMLRGVTIAGEIIPRLIDEIPLLAVAACFAEGVTEIRDAQELRVKESDRLDTMARNLATLGARVEQLPDGLRIWGPTRLHGGVVEAGLDHRIAMAFAIAGWGAQEEIEVQGAASIATSFPSFLDLYRQCQGEQ